MPKRLKPKIHPFVREASQHHSPESIAYLEHVCIHVREKWLLKRRFKVVVTGFPPAEATMLSAAAGSSPVTVVVPYDGILKLEKATPLFFYLKA